MLAFAFFCLLWLPLARFGLLWLLWLLALSVPLLLRFELMLVNLSHFFALVAHFFDFFTHLKLSCNFLTFFNDFSSSFGGFGVVWGWILGGFFEDF